MPELDDYEEINEADLGAPIAQPKRPKQPVNYVPRIEINEADLGDPLPDAYKVVPRARKAKPKPLPPDMVQTLEGPKKISDLGTIQTAKTVKEPITITPAMRADLRAKLRRDYQRREWQGRAPSMRPATENEQSQLSRAETVESLGPVASTVYNLGQRAAEGMGEGALNLLSGFGELSEFGGVGPVGQVMRSLKGRIDPLVESARARRNRWAPPLSQESLEAKVSGQGQFLGEAGGGAASSIPFLAGAGVKAPASVVSGTMGALMEIGSTKRELDIRGVSDPAQRLKAYAGAGVTGATEALGLGRVVDKLGLGRTFREKAINILEDAGQEALQSWLGDINAKYVGGYDPTRQVGSDAFKSAVLGAITSGTFQGVGGAAANAEMRAQQKAIFSSVQQPELPIISAPTGQTAPFAEDLVDRTLNQITGSPVPSAYGEPLAAPRIGKRGRKPAPGIPPLPDYSSAEGGAVYPIETPGPSNPAAPEQFPLTDALMASRAPTKEVLRGTDPATGLPLENRYKLIDPLTQRPLTQADREWVQKQLAGPLYGQRVEDDPYLMEVYNRQQAALAKIGMTGRAEEARQMIADYRESYTSPKRSKRAAYERAWAALGKLSPVELNFLSENIRPARRGGGMDPLVYADLPFQVESPTGPLNVKIYRAPGYERNVAGTQYSVRGSTGIDFRAEHEPRTDTLRLPGPATKSDELFYSWSDAPGGTVYTDAWSHGYVPNVLFELRADNRQMLEGGEGMLINELQSSWAQRAERDSHPFKNQWKKRGLDAAIAEARRRGVDGLLIPTTPEQIAQIQQYEDLQQDAEGNWTIWQNERRIPVGGIFRFYQKELPEMMRKEAARLGVGLETRTVTTNEETGETTQLLFLPLPKTAPVAEGLLSNLIDRIPKGWGISESYDIPRGDYKLVLPDDGKKAPLLEIPNDVFRALLPTRKSAGGFNLDLVDLPHLMEAADQALQLGDRIRFGEEVMEAVRQNLARGLTTLSVADASFPEAVKYGMLEHESFHAGQRQLIPAATNLIELFDVQWAVSHPTVIKAATSWYGQLMVMPNERTPQQMQRMAMELMAYTNQSFLPGAEMDLKNVFGLTAAERIDYMIDAAHYLLEKYGPDALDKITEVAVTRPGVEEAFSMVKEGALPNVRSETQPTAGGGRFSLGRLIPGRQGGRGEQGGGGGPAETAAQPEGTGGAGAGTGGPRYADVPTELLDDLRARVPGLAEEIDELVGGLLGRSPRPEELERVVTNLAAGLRPGEGVPGLQGMAVTELDDMADPVQEAFPDLADEGREAQQGNAYPEYDYLPPGANQYVREAVKLRERIQALVENGEAGSDQARMLRENLDWAEGQIARIRRGELTDEERMFKDYQEPGEEELAARDREALAAIWYSNPMFDPRAWKAFVVNPVMRMFGLGPYAAKPPKPASRAQLDALDQDDPNYEIDAERSEDSLEGQEVIDQAMNQVAQEQDQDFNPAFQRASQDYQKAKLARTQARNRLKRLKEMKADPQFLDPTRMADLDAAIAQAEKDRATTLKESQGSRIEYLKAQEGARERRRQRLAPAAAARLAQPEQSYGIPSSAPYMEEIIETRVVSPAFFKAAKDAMLANNFPLDPDQFVLPQIIEWAKEGRVPLSQFNEIFEREGFDAATFFNQLTASVSSGMRQGAYLSHIRRLANELAKTNPALAKALEAELPNLRELNKLYKERSNLDRFLSIRSGLMISMLETAQRNLDSSGLVVGLDSMGQLFDSAVQHTFGPKRFGNEAALSPALAIRPMLNFIGELARTLDPRNFNYKENSGKVSKTVSAVAAAFEKEVNHPLFEILNSDKEELPGAKLVENTGELLERYRKEAEKLPNDYFKKQKLLEAITAAEKRYKKSQSVMTRGLIRTERLVHALNLFNRAQETIVRRAVFEAKLRRFTAEQGIDLDTLVAEGRAGELPVEIVKRSADEALRQTFGKRPEYGTAVDHLRRGLATGPIGAIVKLGLHPFPTFLGNFLKFNYEHSPLGLLSMMTTKEREKMAGGDLSVIWKSLIGTAIFGMASEMRRKRYEKARSKTAPGEKPATLFDPPIEAGERWYEVKVGSRTLDMRFTPFGPAFYIADLIQRQQRGLGAFETRDLLEAGGASMRGLDQQSDMVASAVKSINDLTQGERAGRVAGKWVGTIAAGFLTPLRQISDIVQFWSPAENVKRDVNQGEGFVGSMLAPMQERVPFLRQRLPEAESYTREAAPERSDPFLRQSTGFPLVEPKNFLEEELDTLGIKPFEIAPRIGNPKADRVVAREMGKFMDGVSKSLEKMPEYRNRSAEERRMILLDTIFPEYHSAVMRAAMAEFPEEFVKAEIARAFSKEMKNVEERRRKVEGRPTLMEEGKKILKIK